MIYDHVATYFPKHPETQLINHFGRKNTSDSGHTFASIAHSLEHGNSAICVIAKFHNVGPPR